MEKRKSNIAAPSVDVPRIVLPRSVRVAAFDFEIVEWGTHAANASRRFGEFSSLEMLIRIDTSVAPMKVMDTMLHEINHAIYWAYGMDDADKEERIVGTMATAWRQHGCKYGETIYHSCRCSPTPLVGRTIKRSNSVR
jgi:hypothetical protein